MQRFDASAARSPDATAISYKQQTVSYKTLHTLSNQLANAIISSGLGKGHVIGLYGHRRYIGFRVAVSWSRIVLKSGSCLASPAVVWAIMGILKSGCAYSMLDPKYPGDRIITCLSVAKVTGFLAVSIFRIHVFAG